jgi:hypothetical protein
MRMFCGVLLKLHSAMKLSLYILVKRKLFHVLLWLWYVLFFLLNFLFRLGQGREKALQYLRENPTICDEIEKVCWIISGFFGMSLLRKNLNPQFSLI